MARKDVDRKKVRISAPPPPESTIIQVDNVFIVITEAYCPNGHNLISEGNEQFDGYPGIALKITANGISGMLYTSPIHGDGTKKGLTSWKEGQKLTICCPQCGVAIPRMAGCHCTPASVENGDLLKLYTSTSLKDSHILAFCNVWGCQRSRTIDNWNLISEYFDGEIVD